MTREKRICGTYMYALQGPLIPPAIVHLPGRCTSCRVKQISATMIECLRYTGIAGVSDVADEFSLHDTWEWELDLYMHALHAL
jgi:hypothetical protein